MRIRMPSCLAHRNTNPENRVTWLCTTSYFTSRKIFRNCRRKDHGFRLRGQDSIWPPSLSTSSARSPGLDPNVQKWNSRRSPSIYFRTLISQVSTPPGSIEPTVCKTLIATPCPTVANLTRVRIFPETSRYEIRLFQRLLDFY